MAIASDVKLRAWWAHRQGLDGRLSGKSPAKILEETGWARSVGSVTPYLTLYARGGISREAADAAVASVEIHELPSARGCTYVLPAADFALGLTVGQAFGGGDRKLALKLGATGKEIDKLCSAVLKALAKGPLEPDELRQAVGGAIRNFGAEGTKKGLTTSLPIALGELQLAGEIRRVPVNGRLDQQRYRYALWRPNPFAQAKLSREQAYTELARRYFHWIGPASLNDFKAFAGIGVKAAKEATAPLALEPVPEAGGRLLLREDRDAYEAFQPPKNPQPVLVGGMDAMLLLRSEIRSLVAAEDLERHVLAEKGPKALGGLQYLPSHAILDRGRIAGLWEYDPEAESIAWSSFVPATPALKQAVKRMEDYTRSQLGDARAFSLDSPKSRATRIAALRQAAG